MEPEKWKEFMKEFGLKDGFLRDNYCYVWENEQKTFEVRTGNNPITGKDTDNTRKDEIGYLSYVNICGDKETVKKATKSFIKKASYIKDYAYGGGFI